MPISWLDKELAKDIIFDRKEDLLSLKGFGNDKLVITRTPGQITWDGFTFRPHEPCDVSGIHLRLDHWPMGYANFPDTARLHAGDTLNVRYNLRWSGGGRNGPSLAYPTRGMVFELSWSLAA